MILHKFATPKYAMSCSQINFWHFTHSVSRYYTPDERLDSVSSSGYLECSIAVERARSMMRKSEFSRRFCSSSTRYHRRKFQFEREVFKKLSPEHLFSGIIID